LQPFFDQLIIGTIFKFSHICWVSMMKPFVEGKREHWHNDRITALREKLQGLSQEML
jgi:hypothetical protein